MVRAMTCRGQSYPSRWRRTTAGARASGGDKVREQRPQVGESNRRVQPLPAATVTRALVPPCRRDSRPRANARAAMTKRGRSGRRAADPVSSSTWQCARPRNCLRRRAEPVPRKPRASGRARSARWPDRTQKGPWRGIVARTLRPDRASASRTILCASELPVNSMRVLRLAGPRIAAREERDLIPGRRRQPSTDLGTWACPRIQPVRLVAKGRRSCVSSLLGAAALVPSGSREPDTLRLAETMADRASTARSTSSIVL